MKLRLTARINKGAKPEAKPTALEHSSTEDWRKKYDHITHFRQGLARVRLNYKYGYVDETGKEVVPVKYDEVGRFYDGFATVRLGDMLTGKYGHVNQTGEEVVPVIYDFARPFSEGLAAVKLKRRWGFVDVMGTVVIPLKYDYVDKFSDGLARVSLPYITKFFYINRRGKEVKRY